MAATGCRVARTERTSARLQGSPENTQLFFVQFQQPCPAPWAGFQSSGCTIQLATHDECAVRLWDDLKAMLPIEPKRWVILQHEQGHGLCCSALFVQPPHDL